VVIEMLDADWTPVMEEDWTPTQLAEGFWTAAQKHATLRWTGLLKDPQIEQADLEGVAAVGLMLAANAWGSWARAHNIPATDKKRFWSFVTQTIDGDMLDLRKKIQGRKYVRFSSLSSDGVEAVYEAKGSYPRDYFLAITRETGSAQPLVDAIVDYIEAMSQADQKLLANRFHRYTRRGYHRERLLYLVECIRRHAQAWEQGETSAYSYIPSASDDSADFDPCNAEAAATYREDAGYLVRMLSLDTTEAAA
jgi:hypothetical protein